METDPNERDFPEEAAAAEIRAALRLTRLGADNQLSFALDLVRRMPAVLDALSSGAIDERRARAIVDGTLHLSEEVARDVADAVLPHAGSWTTGQLRERLRKLCIETNPEDAKKRYERAVDNRRLAADPTVDGTADIVLVDVPPDRAAAVMASINDEAKRLHTADEQRTMDQLRADIALDRLESADGATASGRPGGVVIRGTAEMFAGIAETPGDLNGYGPVGADISRQIAERQKKATWDWELVHPETGQILDVGTTRRRPDAKQRRIIEGNDPRCVFLGCRMPAKECDIDHTVEYSESGVTKIAELAPLCRHDHNRVRHEIGWTYRRLENGDYLWTSPLGHSYTTSGKPVIDGVEEKPP
jgi:hypothetical protein